MVHVLMVGLGKMGGNMAKRLARAAIQVQGVDPQADALRPEFASEHIAVHTDLREALKASPVQDRIIWLMLPHGAPTAAVVEQLIEAHQQGLLGAQPLIVDGANAQYQHTQAVAVRLKDLGIAMMDCGVSGGIWGLDNGYCLMIGGLAAELARVKPVLMALAPAPDRGWLHCGPVGMGHYTKMVHNGIEYAMMQAMAEGFAMMQAQPALQASLGDVAELWRHGSVVRSWLLDLTASALQDPQAMQSVAPVVADSGEGRWALQEAVSQGVPVPTLAMALMSRFDSQGQADTANRILSLMRRGFGGHAVQTTAPVKAGTAD
jgi:6-phosphogluconate dehydrogenase